MFLITHHDDSEQVEITDLAVRKTLLDAKEYVKNREGKHVSFYPSNDLTVWFDLDLRWVITERTE